MSLSFVEKLRRANLEGRYACAGFDPVADKMPPGPWRDSLYKLVLAAILDAAAFKPNWAFFLERRAEGGLELLRDLCTMIREERHDAVIILDMKCGDIGPTNMGYVRWTFDTCGVDAVTVHSYMGSQAMAPFLRNWSQGVFVLCRTSNLGAGEMQDVLLQNGEPYFMHVARTVSTIWNQNANCGLVVGATYPAELELVRNAVPELPLLIPGVGTQGGDLVKTIAAATRHPNHGPFVINVSSSFMYPTSPDTPTSVLRGVNNAVKAHLDAKR